MNLCTRVRTTGNVCKIYKHQEKWNSECKYVGSKATFFFFLFGEFVHFVHASNRLVDRSPVFSICWFMYKSRWTKKVCRVNWISVNLILNLVIHSLFECYLILHLFTMAKYCLHFCLLRFFLWWIVCVQIILARFIFDCSIFGSGKKNWRINHGYAIIIQIDCFHVFLTVS